MTWRVNFVHSKNAQKQLARMSLKALSSVVNFVGSVYESLYLKGAKLKYLVSRPV